MRISKIFSLDFDWFYQINHTHTQTNAYKRKTRNNNEENHVFYVCFLETWLEHLTQRQNESRDETKRKKIIIINDRELNKCPKPRETFIDSIRTRKKQTGARDLIKWHVETWRKLFPISSLSLFLIINF